WLVKVRLTEAGEREGLLDAAAYKAQLELGEEEGGCPATPPRPLMTASACSRRSASTRWTTCSPTSPSACGWIAPWTCPTAWRSRTCTSGSAARAARTAAASDA